MDSFCSIMPQPSTVLMKLFVSEFPSCIAFPSCMYTISLNSLISLGAVVLPDTNNYFTFLPFKTVFGFSRYTEGTFLN